MTIVYDKLLSLDIPEVAQTYTEKDAILYALGLGLGHDPLNADELPFVYEQGIKVLPTFAVVLGWPGFWAEISARSPAQEKEAASSSNCPWPRS